MAVVGCIPLALGMRLLGVVELVLDGQQPVSVVTVATALPTTVTLDYALTLEILDHDAGIMRQRPMESTGRGLIGMRERVALYHGDLQPGPRPAHRILSPRATSLTAHHPMIRILITDDEALVRGGLRMILEAQL